MLTEPLYRNFYPFLMCSHGLHYENDGGSGFIHSATSNLQLNRREEQLRNDCILNYITVEKKFFFFKKPLKTLIICVHKWICLPFCFILNDYSQYFEASQIVSLPYR